MCTYFFLDSNWRGGGSIGQCPASSPSLFFNVHIFVWERFPMCHSLHCHISTLRRLHHVGDHCLFHIIGSRRSCQCRLVLLSYSASISRQSENQTFFFLDSEWNQKLVYFDYGFTCVFAIEVLMKIIDYGVILHPGSYLRELWNVMDMLVVSCAISSFTMDML